MATAPKYIAPQSLVVSLKTRVLFTRTDEETWMLNPPHRYVFNQDTLSNLAAHVDTKSSLKSMPLYRPPDASQNIYGSTLLVERHRERGIGDLLFLTGPLRWLHESKGVASYVHTLANRAAVFTDNPYIACNNALCGPIIYETLTSYDRHWFVDEATEFCAEKDQLNCYDALYAQLGVDHQSIANQYKRPYLARPTDQALLPFFNLLSMERGVDYSTSKYCVIAPLANSNLRSMPYATWLALIDDLSAQMTVFVVGSTNGGIVPTVDIPFASFYQHLTQMSAKNKNVVNMIGETSLRTTINMVNRAQFVVTLDSGTLYIAQALNVPAVSIWGTHHPEARLKYDTRYMDLAVYDFASCPAAPCYAFEGFPRHKCPDKEIQTICVPLARVSVDMILNKIKQI